jgi:hypothetical protein
MTRIFAKPQVCIERCFGHRDGIRWGTGFAKVVPTPRGRFHWTFDALSGLARVFYIDLPSGPDLIEFDNPELCLAVSMIVAHRLAEAQGRAA